MVSLRSLQEPVTLSSVRWRFPVCSCLLGCSRRFRCGRTTQQHVKEGPELPRMACKGIYGVTAHAGLSWRPWYRGFSLHGKLLIQSYMSFKTKSPWDAFKVTRKQGKSLSSKYILDVHTMVGREDKGLDPKGLKIKPMAMESQSSLLCAWPNSLAGTGSFCPHMHLVWIRGILLTWKNTDVTAT